MEPLASNKKQRLFGSVHREHKRNVANYNDGFTHSFKLISGNGGMVIHPPTHVRPICQRGFLYGSLA